MLFKKGLIITSFLLLLVLAIGFVSATQDLNTTDSEPILNTADDKQEVGIDENSILTNAQDDVKEQSLNNDANNAISSVLKDKDVKSASPKTFATIHDILVRTRAAPEDVVISTFHGKRIVAGSAVNDLCSGADGKHIIACPAVKCLLATADGNRIVTRAGFYVVIVTRFLADDNRIVACAGINQIAFALGQGNLVFPAFGINLVAAACNGNNICSIAICKGLF